MNKPPRAQHEWARASSYDIIQNQHKHIHDHMHKQETTNLQNNINAAVYASTST